MKPITNIFLSIEDRARRYFEKMPFIQALVAGVGVIIFWRGIWELLDRTHVSPGVSIVLGCLLLGAVGVFVQTFIGNTIIIKEVKQEEKIEKKAMQKMEGEVGTETVTLAQLSAKLDMVMKKIEER